MPQQLVIEPCLINYNDDRGGVDHAAGDIVEVPKGTAADLARAGRTLYIDRKDDPDKNGRLTATKEFVKAAQDIRRARDKSPEAA